MKKVFIILGSFFALILLAAVLLPIIFKDDIRAAIDKEIKASINANVYYDTDAFGVTLFKNFPNITASVGDFGIAGIDQFEGDTLLDVKQFEITHRGRNIWEILKKSHAKGIRIIIYIGI
ncbi:MAG: hypothetical protein RID25_13405, partial [Cyclobacteriaceae bacterium]